MTPDAPPSSDPSPQVRPVRIRRKKAGVQAFRPVKKSGTYLQRSLRDAGLVIELLSETFLTRPMCLMELGGAWTLGTPTYPIVVPPLTRGEATRQIGNVQMGVLGTDAEIGDIFDELHDRLAQHLASQCNLTAWNRAIADFKQQLPSRLARCSGGGHTKPFTKGQRTNGVGRVERR